MASERPVKDLKGKLEINGKIQNKRGIETIYRVEEFPGFSYIETKEKKAHGLYRHRTCLVNMSKPKELLVFKRGWEDHLIQQNYNGLNEMIRYN